MNKKHHNIYISQLILNELFVYVQEFIMKLHKAHTVSSPVK